jgi:hypothetical protein
MLRRGDTNRTFLSLLCSHDRRRLALLSWLFKILRQCGHEIAQTETDGLRNRMNLRSNRVLVVVVTVIVVVVAAGHNKQLCTAKTWCYGVTILLSREECDWILNLLSTCTTCYYTSQIVSTSCFLLTVSNSGESSASALTLLPAG